MERGGKNPKRSRHQDLILEAGAKHQAQGRLRSVKELKSRAAKRAAINDRWTQEHAELRSGVNPAAPNAAAKSVKIFGVLADQHRFGFTIPVLLLHVGADGRAAIMPHKRSRAEADPIAYLLQSPANVHVIP